MELGAKKQRLTNELNELILKNRKYKPSMFYPATHHVSPTSSYCAKLIGLRSLLKDPVNLHEDNSGLNRYAAIGHAIEEDYLNSLGDAVIARQIPIHNSEWAKEKYGYASTKLSVNNPENLGFNVHGYIDGIININGEIIVTDVKSDSVLEKTHFLYLSDDEYKNMLETGEFTFTESHIKDKTVKNICGVRYSHEQQILLYAAMTGFYTVNLAYCSRLVKENMSDEPTERNEIMTFTKKDIEAFLLRISVSKSLAQRGKLVPKPSQMNTQTKCGFCVFKPHCWQDFPLDTSLFKTFQIATTEEVKEEMKDKRQQIKLFLSDENVQKRRAFFSRYETCMAHEIAEK